LTMDICGTVGSKGRSYISANNVTDVALYTEPAEIYLMKHIRTVVLYDATAKTETVKVDNSSAPEASSGQPINSVVLLYEINLDLYQYGMSRNESVCIYTNTAFLAAPYSKRFVLFNVNGVEPYG